MKREILYYGDPILREKCKPIEAITDDIRQLARDLIDTMVAYDGVGLAAPQVGVLLRIFVSNVDFEDENGELHLCEPRVYINPTLTNAGDAIVERSEGCLSLPKLYLAVPRPISVTVEATDLNGTRFKRECYGYLARNMMHENDHLNGVLFFDWIKGKRRTQIEPQLRMIKQKYAKKTH